MFPTNATYRFFARFYETVIKPTQLALVPFPHWPSFFFLWKVLLFRCNGVNLRGRLKQARFLLAAGLGAPFQALFWHLDEIFFPQYRTVKIRPVFIVGSPRSGTTFLHRTLAADEDNFFAVRHLEWRYPSITLRFLIRLVGIERWLLSRSYWPEGSVGELAAKMHSNTLEDWEEDGIFFEENFLFHLFLLLRFPDACVIDWMDAFNQLSVKDQDHMMDMYHKTLQKVAYASGRPDRLFLSKEVMSNHKIPRLFRQYPDARFIVTVRSSSYFLSSLLPLARVSTESKVGQDPHLCVERWQEAFVGRMRRESNLLVDVLEKQIFPSIQTRVDAQEVMRQVHPSVEFIYKELGLNLSPHRASELRSRHELQRQRRSGYDYQTLTFEGFEKFDGFVEDVAESFCKKMQQQQSTCSNGI